METYLGMERLIEQFHAIVREFRLKRHDLLDYHNNKFDRDYVEFNVKVRKFRLQFDFFVFSSAQRLSSRYNLLRFYLTILLIFYYYMFP